MSGAARSDLTVLRLRIIAESPPGKEFKQYIYKADAAMLVDAVEIADSSARADIECNVPFDHDGAGTGAHWYNLDRAADEDAEAIAQAERYLEARGILLRDAKRRRVVSFKDPA